MRLDGQRRRRRRRPPPPPWGEGAGGGVSRLMYACQQGDVGAVRRQLDLQPKSVRLRDRSGKSALHYCCTSDSRHAAQAADLVAMAAPDLVDSRDEDGFTPLHLAVIAGNMPLVTFLLASNADINAVDSEQHTVVHWATVCGETEALRAVIAAGAPVSTPDVHGGYPLHYAAQMCGGEKDSELGQQVMQTLLAHPNISATVADGDGRQPLLWAASAGASRALLALVRAGAPVEASDKDGLTALHCAASRGHTDCLDTLLTLCGASVDVIDSNGCTALHYAVTLGHADATALLLAHGANANRQDRKGRSPAHCGCAKGQLETVKMLGAHGANLWLRNARGDLPLHEAAGSGRRDLVKWLLEFRPSQVNARNNDGRCPLHLAALNDNPDMCKILLDLGAQVNPVLRTSKNVFMTPLDCALQRGFRSTAKYLQMQGGLPASRTRPAVNVQIKDDLAVVERTSSDDNEENSEERQKKRSTYKRRVAYSFKTPSSLDKKEKSPRERLTYNSEVKILDKSETVNIHQNGSVIINKDSPKVKKKTRPKSIIKQKKDTPLPSRKEEINENIKEIESLAHSIEEKAKNICKEVGNIGSNLQAQPESLTSLDEPEEQAKSLVVEAAVHEPPADLYKEVLQTLRDELNSIRDEIKTIREEGKTAVLAKQIGSIEHKVDVIKESEDSKQVKAVEEKQEAVLGELKRDIEEIKSKIQENAARVVEELKEDLKNTIKEEIATSPLRMVERRDEILTEDEFKRRTEEERLMQEKAELEKLKEELQQQKDQLLLQEQQLQQQQEQQVQQQLEEQQLKQQQEQQAQQQLEEQQLKQQQEQQVQQQLEEQQLQQQQQQIQKQQEEQQQQPIEEDIVQVTSDEPKVKVAEVVEIQAANAEEAAVEESSQQLPPQTVVDGEETPQPEPEPEAAKVEVEETIEEDIPEPAAQIHPEEPVEDTKPVIEAGFMKAEKGVADAKQAIDKAEEGILEAKESIDKVEEGLVEIKTASEELFGEKVVPDEPPKAKSDHHLHIPRYQQDSSIDAKSSDSEDSDSPSVVKREHKSFTVLDETLPKRRKSSRKTRSRSEEARKSKLQRSKIPTSTAKTEPRSKSNIEDRIPFLPELKAKTKSDTNLAEIKDDSDEDFDSIRRKKSRRRTKAKSAKSASDYESSNLIDSGFEPSPRSTRVPKWNHMTDRGVNMASVTQSIQGNIRRYHLERKIFQHLLDLKRMQIRSGQHNESVLVKRAIDTYHRSCASTVGAGRYIPRDYTFKSFEIFLYESLRKIQKHAAPDYLKGLPEAVAEHPLLCTQNTSRCMHATHAYTGIPCAAYLPKMDHHSIPKIGFDSCKPQHGFLPSISSQKKAVTLELCHGNDKQVISLPTDRLDRNKRYYVTFTVKGQPSGSTSTSEDKGDEEIPAHRHAKSV